MLLLSEEIGELVFFLPFILIIPSVFLLSLCCRAKKIKKEIIYHWSNIVTGITVFLVSLAMYFNDLSWLHAPETMFRPSDVIMGGRMELFFDTIVILGAIFLILYHLQIERKIKIFLLIIATLVGPLMARQWSKDLGFWINLVIFTLLGIVIALLLKIIIAIILSFTLNHYNRRKNEQKS